MKGRTDEGGTDREPDTAADTTSRWGGSESLLDGKHGNLQVKPSGLAALRVSCPGLVGTAGYGAVCPVVWDPWLAEQLVQSVAGTQLCPLV
jgi:hypothetical protein